MKRQLDSSNSLETGQNPARRLAMHGTKTTNYRIRNKNKKGYTIITPIIPAQRKVYRLIVLVKDGIQTEISRK